MVKTFIIAEAGVNHNGDKDIALRLIDVAAESGADAIKFQTFKAKNLATKYAKKAEYQFQTITGEETQFQMLKDLELSEKMHYELISYCAEQNIQFLSTAFDIESLKFLTDNLGLKILKIPSGEITNAPLLLAFGKTGRQIIISTGMSELLEVKEALGVLAFGLIHGENKSLTFSRKAFSDAFNSIEGQSLLKQKVTIMHCVTDYPASPEDINLKAIKTMRDSLNLRIGYSDHTLGIIAPIAAVSLGALVIEKHFTLDNNLPGPDHKASLEPSELKKMVEEIRNVEQLMGDGTKKAMPSELKNKPIARKSIVAATNIKKGEVFSDENLTMKRPGSGRSPMEFWDIVGTKVTKNYEIDEMIT